jgi:Cysteine-rich secretory protein family
MSSLIYVSHSLLSTESGVTAEERRLILEEHNYLRQTVATGHVPGQPSAQNMQEMRWDDELAAMAQQWANECTFQHDPSRYLGESSQAFHLNSTQSAKPNRKFAFQAATNGLNGTQP